MDLEMVLMNAPLAAGRPLGMAAETSTVAAHRKKCYPDTTISISYKKLTNVAGRS
jgi:hypothetical protein